MPTVTIETLEALALSVLGRLSEDLPAAQRTTFAGDTPIMGAGSVLDSLGVANFIVGLEESLERELGTAASLSDLDLVALFEEPSVTVRRFAGFLFNELKS